MVKTKKKNANYFIEYKKCEKIKPLVAQLPQMNGYPNEFKGTK